MNDGGHQRRLSAVLAADVVGYTRLMEEDTDGTVAAWKSARINIIDPTIANYSGRIVKHTGDGFLAEFKTVHDAVKCAIAMQGSLVEAPLDFRIGIHLGDVVDDGEDIHGEGVNIAARVEALAEPGGVSITGGVHDQIRNRVDHLFIDTGEHSVKHVSAPVRVWRWSQNKTPTVIYDDNLGAKDVELNLELPDVPSIAVLPFDNMSNVPDEDFLGDGIAEDLITALSKFRSLFVIARNSSFSFKGNAVEAKEISKRLGVRYLVEGSVRRSGNRARITAQLIDATEDKHIWAERYDRNLEDIFAVQDEVTLAIVQAVQPHLVASEQMRARRKPPENLDAWENFQRGMWHLFRYHPDELEMAISFLHRAKELDPNFATATACLGYAHCLRMLHGVSVDHTEDIKTAIEYGQMAAKLDENEPYAYLTIGRASIFARRYEEALSAIRKSLQLNPNFALGHMIYGHGLWHAGRPEEAIPSIDVAIRSSPHDPLMWVFLSTKAIALAMLERFDEAISASRTAQQNPNAAVYAFLGELSALGQMGEEDTARDALNRALTVKSDLSIGYLDKALPATECEYWDLFRGGLRKAGVPE